MYKLLIADDDEILRAGIQKNIDWKANGIEVVGAASNGLECMELVAAALPQIVLADIQMPFMDGLQLAEALNHLYPQIQVILLTAYNEFEYAKKAVRCRVSDYVMKSEDNAVILNAVKKAAAEYEKIQNTEEIVQRGQKLLVEQFLQTLVGRSLPQKEITAQAEKLNLNFSAGGIQVLCAEIFPEKQQGTLLFWEMNALCEQCGALLEEALKREKRFVYAFPLKERLVLLVSAEEEPEQQELEEAVVKLYGSMRIRVLIGAGSMYSAFTHVQKSYNEAVQALDELENRSKSSERRVLRYADCLLVGNNQTAVLQSVKEYIKKNYADEHLSLNLIAQEVHLTPNYISTLFKKHGKENLIDYITKVRIRKAQELLRNTEDKVYQVAQQVGYTNAQYFSMLFKRSCTVTPAEYRQNQKNSANREV